MALPFQNVYHLRTVADASAKPCFVCMKTSNRVLITTDNKDFFYTCIGHLKDRGFAIPVTDQEAEDAKKKDEDLKKEIEKVKAEYLEKLKKKREKKKADKDGKKDDDKEAAKEDEEKAEKERDDKIAALQKAGDEPKSDDLPRIYNLHKNFFTMRIQRLRKIEADRRNQQRFQNPNLFPAPPKNDL